MELVMEEYGQALLAMLVMAMGIMLVIHLIVDQGILNETVKAYMQSIGG